MSARSSCPRKAKYSKAEAKHEVKRRMARGALGMKTYHCSNCGYYHLTSWTRYFMSAEALAKLTDRKRRKRSKRTVEQ